MGADHYSGPSLAEHRTRRQTRPPPPTPTPPPQPEGWCCLIYRCTDSLNLTTYFREHQSRETLLLIAALRKHQLAMSSPQSRASKSPSLWRRKGKGGGGAIMTLGRKSQVVTVTLLSVKWDMNCRTNSHPEGQSDF